MPKPSEGLPLHNFKFLEIKDFEFLCFDLAGELMTFQEPIPDYSERDNGLLESALANPKQGFGGKLLYPTLAKQAAILFYSLIKNHPFRNGNKRVAVMSLLMHLGLNNKWLDIPPIALYELACEVSESDPKKKDGILERFEKEIEKYLIDPPKNLISSI